MKLKKILFKVIILFMITLIIILISLIFKSSNNNYKNIVVLGNQIEKNEMYDDTFTSSFMDAQFLLKMLENDASKTVDNKIVKLSSLIDKSEIVIINIGLVDITSKIKENTFTNTLEYDIDILNRQVDVYEDLLNQIIDKIKLYNDKTSIYLSSLKYPYEINDSMIYEIIKKYNNIIDKMVQINDLNNFQVIFASINY